MYKTYYPQGGGRGYTRAIIAIVVFVTLLVSFRTLADESIHMSSGEPSVGTLLEEHLKSLPYMCECEFYRGPINGETMVFATRNERAVGFAVVDGQLITLKRDGKPADTQCRKCQVPRAVGQ